jgi:ribonuclease R
MTASLEKSGEHLSMTERRAMTAERDTIDRYLTAYLSDSIGATFTGHITGVTRFGLFVALEDSGAEGLIPISTLPGGFYRHDPRRHTLEGKSGHRIFTLGATVEVRLTEADTTKGSMAFQLCDSGSEPKRRRPRRAKIERRRKRRR